MKRFFTWNKSIKIGNYIKEIKKKFVNPDHDYPKAYKKLLYSVYRSLNYEYNENFNETDEYNKINNNIEKKGFQLLDNNKENFISFTKNINNFNFEIFCKVKATEIPKEISELEDLLNFSNDKDNKDIDFIVGNGKKVSSNIIRRGNRI